MQFGGLGPLGEHPDTRMPVAEGDWARLANIAKTQLPQTLSHDNDDDDDDDPRA